MYTAISNTPTRITLLSSGGVNQIPQGIAKPKSKKGSRVQKRKV